MGVGTPDDLVGAVQRGIDMFDCVIPTRAGRTARAYTSRGVLNLRNARFADDAAPLDPAAPARPARATAAPICTTCSGPSEMLGPMLLTWHNLTYYQDLMRGLRDAICRRASCAAHAAALRARWARGGRRMTERRPMPA